MLDVNAGRSVKVTGTHVVSNLTDKGNLGHRDADRKLVWLIMERVAEKWKRSLRIEQRPWKKRLLCMVSDLLYYSGQLLREVTLTQDLLQSPLC